MPKLSPVANRCHSSISGMEGNNRRKNFKINFHDSIFYFIAGLVLIRDEALVLGHCPRYGRYTGAVDDVSIL